MSDPKKIPPTPAEVREFFACLGSAVDPERFFDYYEANGWKVGRVKMVNWQATAKNWNRTDLTNKSPKNRPALSEWEIKQKAERLRDLRERKRAITHPGGSAFGVSLTPEKIEVVRGLEEKIEALKKELGE